MVPDVAYQAVNNGYQGGTAGSVVIIRYESTQWATSSTYQRSISEHHEMCAREREAERRFRAALAHMKAIAAFPAFLDVAAEPHDPAMHAVAPEPRIPTARRAGCRARARRPMLSRPGARRHRVH